MSLFQHKALLSYFSVAR